MYFSKLSKQFVVIIVIFISGIIPIGQVNATEVLAESGNNQFTNEIISLTNIERVENGVKELEFNEILASAAQMKADNMAEESYFSHTSPDGISPWHWFYEAGYKPRYAGENLALSYSTTTKIIDSWMNSPSHRSNIVKEQYTEIGIGISKGYYNGNEVYFTVQLFGLPSNKK